MLLMPRRHDLFRRLGSAAGAIALLVVCLMSAKLTEAQGCTTTVTGKVYSPAGPAKGDPIPNILVYIPQTAVLPFSSTVGPGVTGGCAAQANLVSGNPLVSATTDAGGNFTLTTTGLTTGNWNVVIQAGKWRQQYPNTAITACSANAIGNLSMPAAQSSTADLPKIAVVTGSADSIECIFQQIGISGSEITDPTGTGSINFYQGATGAGQYISSNTPKEAALVGVPATLDNYDVVIFGCQGNKNEADATPTNQQNMVDYANSGGRIFATHYGYNWLYNISPFESSATWTNGNEQYSSGSNVTVPATIDQSYPEGVILAQWLQNIGASYNNVQGQIGLQQVRTDTTGVNNPPAQSWVTLNSNAKEFSGNPSMQFTFNTPIGNTGVPTVAVTYTNTTTLFQPGDIGDSIVVNVTNSSTTAADATLTLTLALPSGITATSLVDSSGGNWNCPNLSTLICTRTVPLAAGASDNVTLTFSIATTINVGQSTITASLSGGNLSSTGQCGRVLYNDYHVEQTSGNYKYPQTCSTGLTSQERFLEFSLYNLSNFIAPSNTDVIVIQGQPVITWPTPAAIPYGTPLSSTQLDATATFNGTTVPGTFVYTPAAGTEPAVGTDTLNVAFTPTDTTDYETATGSTTIVVQPDSTTTTLTNIVTPIYYGQIVADTALETAVSNGPAAINVGVLNFYIDSVIACTLPANVAGTCPSPTGVGYNAGTHTIQSCYVDNVDGNFTGSCSQVYNVVVQPDPTSVLVTSSADPSSVNQAVTLTATITDQYATAAGTVQFFDGTLLIGTGTANAQGAATLTVSNLIVGKHNITACFLASQNFLGSCSPNFLQLVTLVPTGPLATVTLLTSSANPSIIGQAVTFAASVATTGAFVSIPAGTLTFYDGTTVLNSTTLDANGNASFTTSTLTVGTHPITAVYTGNAVTATSTSTVVQQVVLTTLPSAGTGFLLTVTPTTLSLGVGASATLSVSVLSLNNYNQAVKLTCSGLPAEVGCAFAQSTIPIGGGTTTLVISTAAPHACGANTPYFIGSNRMTELPLLAVTALGLFFTRRRRKLFRGLTLMLALCLVPMLNGCSSPCTDLGTDPNVYNVTVTATSTGSPSTSQSQVIQMNVHI